MHVSVDTNVGTPDPSSGSEWYLTTQQTKLGNLSFLVSESAQHIGYQDMPSSSDDGKNYKLTSQVITSSCLGKWGMNV